MKLFFYTVIIFLFSFLLLSHASANSVYVESAFLKYKSNFKTLVKNSLENKIIKKPNHPINVPILDILSHKIKPVDTMGNLQIFSNKDYVAITIKGEMYKQIYHSIKFWIDKYDKNKDKALIFLINSTGGYVNSIKDFKTNIDTNRLTTIITGEATSSAAMLFFLGYRRLVFEHSLLGFHASKTAKNLEDKIFIQDSSKDSLALNQKYLPNKSIVQKNKLNNFLLLIEKMGSFASDKISYFNTKTLLGYNLVQKISSPNIIIDKVWIKTKNKLLKCKNIF